MEIALDTKILTCHLSLRAMLDQITKDRIIDYAVRCTEALRRLGVTEGTMAIAGFIRTPVNTDCLAGRK